MSKTNGIIEWEDAKGKIFLRLVNYEKNKTELEEKAYVTFLDLAALFYCSQDESGPEGFYVGREHLCAWNQDTGSILQTARENTFRKGNVFVASVTDLLKKAGYGIPCGTGAENMVKKPMTVLTNKPGFFGAAMLLNTQELKRLADQFCSDLYLLPCSLHEILAVCPCADKDVSYLTDMVNEANSSAVLPEDYLSGHVYYFDREKGEVTMAIPA